MNYTSGMIIAKRYGLGQDFALSYRQIKPWWKFWMPEHEAVMLSLEDLDIAPPST